MPFRPASQADLAALLELRREFCEHEGIAFRGTLNGLETLFYVKLFGRSSRRLARSTMAPR